MIKGWTRGVEIEEEAHKQLRNLAGLPFIHKHIAVMPDVHFGMGATVGSVIATKQAIIPAAVGVDIGCGMMAIRTELVASDLPDSLAAMRTSIEAVVPHGRTDDGGPNDRGAWHDLPYAVDYAFNNPCQEDHKGQAFSLGGRLGVICEKHPKLERPSLRAINHLGTLGTGNHFVEVCLDEAQRVWVMLHSGSRGIGNAIGRYFIEKAKEEMQRWYVNLPDVDLAYLPEGSTYFDDYIQAVSWAQAFAKSNREIMMGRTLATIQGQIDKPMFTTRGAEMAVNCHHNYVSRERHWGENVFVTRKGAVRAGEGDLGIIPGSMGAKSFIVRGKGNPDSFCSCSHGAGRKMSRTEAKRKFSVADHVLATQGVECRKDEEVVDETPAAYKDIDAVMAAQADLVDVVHTLKQVLCVKG